MKPQQRKAMLAAFNALMQEVGAVHLPDAYPYTYSITWDGHTLGVTLYLDSDGPWIACKWQTGDPALLRAYRDAKGGDVLADENDASRAAWAAYAAARDVEYAVIRASSLPYHNPHSLKWNHHAEDPVASLRDGLRPLTNQKKATTHAS